MKDLDNLIKGEFSTFCSKFKMYATCAWSYLEPAKDLIVSYHQWTYKNYIMAVLLTFFMYLPVAQQGIMTIK